MTTTLPTTASETPQTTTNSRQPMRALFVAGVLISAGLASACGSEMLHPAEPGLPPVDAPTDPNPVNNDNPPEGCTAPALLVLDAIPDQPTLDDSNPETLAIFEVNGHDLIGKFVRDRAAAEGGLRLWQEITLRIPANQLTDLVQFEISQRSDPTAYFNRRGRVTTQRFGLKIGFGVNNFDRNQLDVCAPLEPRRGTFDWSLIHEFGHLRGLVDGSWERFLETFPDVEGPGHGYPDDGSPVLTGDFVTSYAERADGDEDHAETFTTYMMLPDSALPAEMPGGPGAVAKIHWMSSQPGMQALRRALRVTEPDGSSAPIDPAPSLFAPIDYSFPAGLLGTWQEVHEYDGAPDGEGWRIVATSDDMMTSNWTGGVEGERFSLEILRREKRRIGYLTVGDFTPNDEGERLFSYITWIQHRGHFEHSFISTDPSPSSGAPRILARMKGGDEVTLELVP